MKISRFRHSRSGFTLVELIIGMAIFSLAITSIFLLLQSTMKSVSISRNEIVVANILREQIELVRNVRDSNIYKAALWNAARIDNDGTKVLSGGIFTIENDFTASGTVFTSENNQTKISESPVKISSVNFSSVDMVDKFDTATLKQKFDDTQLCFDDKKRYVHCTNDEHKTNSGTVFASYMHIFPMYYTDASWSEIIIQDNSPNPNIQWFILDARVIVRDGSQYREYDARSAITDWQR